MHRTPRQTMLAVLAVASASLPGCSAANPDVKLEAGQRCEANYYLGQWYLLRGERNEATTRFHAAQGLCPQSFLEYTAAVAELKRMR